MLLLFFLFLYAFVIFVGYYVVKQKKKKKKLQQQKQEKKNLAKTELKLIKKENNKTFLSCLLILLTFVSNTENIIPLVAD